MFLYILDSGIIIINSILSLATYSKFIDELRQRPLPKCSSPILGIIVIPKIFIRL